ncbi:MAG: DEAD/DEAH box helicase [Candidatus Woesearchaeota archaeon]
MEFKGFVLDKFQEEAISSIEKNHSAIVSAPTGSGKTLIADYIIDRELKVGKRVIYTSPIKALSNQKYHDFCEDYGEEKIGIMTGDIVIRPEAPILIMTTEVYRNKAIVRDEMLKEISYCIMDEIHFIADEERGHVWEESIIFAPEQTRFLFLSATIPNAREFASWVTTIKEHKVDVVEQSERPVPLEISFYDSELGITTLKKIKERKELDNIPDYKELFSRHQRHITRIRPPDLTELITELRKQERLPCICFVFSRAKTQEYGLRLAKQEFLGTEEKTKVSMIVSAEMQKLSQGVKQLKSTINLRNCMAKGVAFHNAGMLPEAKHLVEKLFSMGLIKVLFATETFAVGINMPARTVVFDSLRKFTGTEFRSMNSKEFFQLAGRAGRRGIDKVGYAIAIIHRPSADLEQIAKFTKKDDMPIKSQFRLSYNSVLNMIDLHTKEEIEVILKMNFFTFQETKGNKRMVSHIRARFDNLAKELHKMKYVENGKLTALGRFTTKIFSNEIEISQLFAATNHEFDEYDMLLTLGSLVYEEKKEHQFEATYPTKKINRLMLLVQSNPYLRKHEWIKNMEKITAILYPTYQQKKFEDIMKNTNMPEGDLIRFFGQLTDKLEQIDRASTDSRQRQIVRNCKHLIKNTLSGIQVL